MIPKLNTDGSAVADIQFRAGNQFSITWDFGGYVFPNQLFLKIDTTSRKYNFTQGSALQVTGGKVSLSVNSLPELLGSYELNEWITPTTYKTRVKGKISGTLSLQKHTLQTEIPLQVNIGDQIINVSISSGGQVDLSGYLQSLPGYDPDVPKVLTYDSNGFFWAIGTNNQPEPTFLTFDNTFDSTFS